MSYSYLASPYSSSDHTVMLERYHQAIRATAWLLSKRIWVYSPIVHCHEVAKQEGLPHSFAFWADYDKTMLKIADTVIVLAIEGWQQSMGVQQELTWARRLKTPVRYLRPQADYFILSKELP